jgi:hypothetical protein
LSSSSQLAGDRDRLLGMALAQQDLTHTTYEADRLAALVSLPDREAKLLAARTWKYRDDEEQREHA